MGNRFGIVLRGSQRDLVATDDFRQGEVVLVLPSVSQPLPDKYSIEIGPGIHINCSASLAGAINHSCDPNAVVRNGRIVAWVCIKAGDSITIDYHRTESKLAEPFQCGCGHCEGDWIYGKSVHRMA